MRLTTQQELSQVGQVSRLSKIWVVNYKSENIAETSAILAGKTSFESSDIATGIQSVRLVSRWVNYIEDLNFDIKPKI